MSEQPDHVDIAFQYRESVLGKDVWVQFPVENSDLRFFKGTITRMTVSYPEDDTTKSLEYTHYIHFGDDDDGFYNLTDLETTGYLRWNDNGITEKKTSSETSVGSGTTQNEEATNTNISTTTTAVPVTPQRGQKRSSDSSSTQPKARVKQEPGVIVGVNITDPSNNEIELPDFENWLRRIHKRSRGQPISNANARSVMNRVNDLILGRGIQYKNWPDGIKFHENHFVDLGTDFVDLLQQAKQFEKAFGEDKGHGWLLKHPIRKLQLYKEYIQDKRHERANPYVIA